MTDKERLLAWMAANGYDYRSLAIAMHYARTNIHMILNDKRALNDSFKWRFKRVFGNEITDAIFVDDPTEVTEMEPA